MMFPPMLRRSLLLPVARWTLYMGIALLALTVGLTAVPGAFPMLHHPMVA